MKTATVVVPLNIDVENGSVEEVQGLIDKINDLLSNNSNKEFAKKHNFEIGKRYIEILSNKDSNGKNIFRLWFNGKYFYDNDNHWKGQIYQTHVSSVMKNFDNVIILPTNFEH